MAALKGGFTQEKEVSRCLQAELQSIAARLSAIETKIEDHAKISAQLGNLAQQESFVKPDEASSSRWAAVKKSSYKAAHKFPVEDLEATLEKRTLFMDIYDRQAPEPYLAAKRRGIRRQGRIWVVQGSQRHHHWASGAAVVLAAEQPIESPLLVMVEPQDPAFRRSLPLQIESAGLGLLANLMIVDVNVPKLCDQLDEVF
ncbi:hypothetical protein NHJ13734_009322 [Beauveria thailandica]